MQCKTHRNAPEIQVVNDEKNMRNLLINTGRNYSKIYISNNKLLTTKSICSR